MAEGDESVPREYRYNPLDEPLYEDALVLLVLSQEGGEVHIPTFASKVLEELWQTGLLHRRDTEPQQNMHRVRVKNRQEVLIRFDTYRDAEGYMAVDVVDAPRLDAAIFRYDHVPDGTGRPAKSSRGTPL